MTIIQPNKNKNFFRFFFLVFSLLLLSGGIYIYEYNSFVDIRHKQSVLKQDISDLRAVNADFKNKLYVALDPVNLESLAGTNQLTLERKPEYFNN